MLKSGYFWYSPLFQQNLYEIRRVFHHPQKNGDEIFLFTISILNSILQNSSISNAL